MPEQDAGARELQHPEKVLDVILPASDQPTGVVQPGEEAFDFPASPPPTQWPAILGGGAAAIAFVSGDQFDAVAVAQQRIERVAVIAAIADQSRGEFGEEARVEGGGDEVRLIR